MCIGDGNKKLQATIDIDTSSLGGLTDILNKQPTDTEVAAEETVEATEETTAPNLLNQPVLDKLEKMAENLPERTTGETMRAMMPAIQQSDQMMHHMNRDQMRMLERIMQRTGRRPFNPRGPRGGSFGKGGGHMVHPGLAEISDPRKKGSLANPSREQLAGLSKLFGRPTQLPNFPQQQMATPMQPEVVEEQQEMEILGQPKQFAGGGIVNALMATPVGQAAIKQYAEGGDIKFGDYVFDYKLTDDDPLDILRGRIYDDGRKARFFSSEAHMKDPSEPVVTWGKKKDIVEQITEDLTPQRRKKKKVEEPHQDDAGGASPDPTPVDFTSLTDKELTNMAKSGFKGGFTGKGGILSGLSSLLGFGLFTTLGRGANMYGARQEIRDRLMNPGLREGVEEYMPSTLQPTMPSKETAKQMIEINKTLSGGHPGLSDERGYGSGEDAVGGHPDADDLGPDSGQGDTEATWGG